MVVSNVSARIIRRVLVRLAREAPVRAFAVEGVEPPGPLEDLRLRDGVRLVDSPRSANVLLVAGELPVALHDAARRVHDMMSHPRATVWWTRAPGSELAGPPFPGATIVGPHEDVVHALKQVQRDLLTKRRPSDTILLPDEEPAPWRGVGPYGQGGMGMTGGKPYGRPIAERAADRDGLELDQLPIRVGPFFQAFPTGLVLDVRCQGDVIQDVIVGDTPFAATNTGHHHAIGDVFHRALSAPVSVAELELTRARHHLRWLAHALRVHGLETLGRRVLGCVPALRPNAGRDIVALRRLLEATRALTWSTAGVGVTKRDLVAGHGLGPVARAAGLAEDARLDDPAYGQLGFEPVLHPEGDARARWRQRLMEAIQSLDLAARAGDRTTGSVAVVEAPRGRLRADGGPMASLVAIVPGLLQGMEWGDAVTTIVSLDLELREPGLLGSETTVGAHSSPERAA